MGRRNTGLRGSRQLRGPLTRWLYAAAVLLFILACGDRPQPIASNPEQRIVSLSPAFSQVIIDLGLSDHIVAVGEYDQIAPIGTPSLGRFNDLDLERLIAIAPTHVLAMTSVAQLPRRVHEMAQQGRFELIDLGFPDTVGDASQLIADVGVAVGRPDQAALLKQTVEARLAGIARLTATRQHPRALMLFGGTSQVMACGPGTVHDELLNIAGGQNAAASSAVQAPVFDREALQTLSPDVIFLLQPGAPPLSGLDDARLDAFRGLGLPAMRDGRVVLLNDPAVLLAGPSMPLTAASMVVALHPDLAESVAEVFRDTP